MSDLRSRLRHGERIQQSLGCRLKFVFRNFPITGMHPHAKDAAQAAEASGAQGAFWEMHDMLFENQDDLTHDDLEKYAKELGLDASRLIGEVQAGPLCQACRRRLSQRCKKWRERHTHLFYQQRALRPVHVTSRLWFLRSVRR